MRRLYSSVIFCIIIKSGLAQTDSLLAKAKLADVFENVFLHTDKSNYVAGETIWLKAYLYDGLYPSSKSSAIKIQLINGDSDVITEKIYPVVAGIANGEIRLPAKLGTGRCFLRAMGNATATYPGQSYLSPILVNNPSVTQKVEIVPYKKIALVKFICPGGFVGGQVNQAYISITDQYKQPMQSEGFLLSAEKDTVASFNTNYLGIAELHIIPDASQTYSVFLAGDTTTKCHIPSSAILNNGIAMTVYAKDSMYNILLNATQAMATQDYNLVAEYSYNRLTTIKVHFNNNGAFIKLPVKLLPSGINRLVLLNPAGEAVCERYIFSANTSVLMPVGATGVALKHSDTAVSSIKFLIDDTAENTISINALDNDYDFGDIYKPENLLNRFLLTGYFKQFNPAYAGLIDNLALADVPGINGLLATQELLKPSWQEMRRLEKDAPHNVPSYSYINLKGTVLPDGYKALPKASSLTVILSAVDSSRNLSIQPLDNDGKFEMDDLIFTDSVTLYYKLNSKTPKPIKLALQVDQPANYFKGIKNDWSFLGAIAPVQPVAVSGYNSPTTSKQKLLFSAAVDTLKPNELANVTVHSVRSFREKTKAVNDKYTTTVFSREASETFNMLDEPVRPGQNVIDYLRMFGRRMTITESNGDGNIVKPGWGGGVPYTLFANEGRTTFNYLKGLELSEVALIKVYESSFIMADNNGPAIAVYLRKGGDNIAPVDPQMQKIKIAGYSPVKSFINPTANNLSTINGKALLSTFYWEPNVTFNKTQQDDIQFYNINKVPKAIIVLQGMAGDGRLVYFKQTANAQ